MLLEIIRRNQRDLWVREVLKDEWAWLGDADEVDVASEGMSYLKVFATREIQGQSGRSSVSQWRMVRNQWPKEVF